MASKANAAEVLRLLSNGWELYHWYSGGGFYTLQLSAGAGHYGDSRGVSNQTILRLVKRGLLVDEIGHTGITAAGRQAADAAGEEAN